VSAFPSKTKAAPASIWFEERGKSAKRCCAPGDHKPGPKSIGNQGMLRFSDCYLAHTGFGAVHDESVYTVP